MPLSLYAQLPARMFALRLPAAAYAVYGVLDLRAGRRGWWYGTQDELQAATGYGDNAVRGAVRALREHGLIATDRAGRRDGVMMYRVAHRTGAEQAALDGSVRRNSAEPDRRNSAGPRRSVRRNSAEPTRVSSSSHKSHRTTEGEITTGTDPYEQVIRREWPA